MAFWDWLRVLGSPKKWHLAPKCPACYSMRQNKKPPLCKGRWQKSLIFDGGIVRYLHLTIPQSFCFAKIQPPLHKGAFLLSLTVQRLRVEFFYSCRCLISSNKARLVSETANGVTEIRP